MRLAQEAYPLWRELEAEWGRALLEQPGTLDLGDWQANRDALAACGAPFEVLDAAEIERRFPIRLETARPASSSPTAGSSTPTSRCRRCSARRPLRARTSASERASGRSRTRARRSSLDGLRAKAVVVTAGAWAPALVGVDATPTRETTSYFSLDEPVPSRDRAEPRRAPTTTRWRRRESG